MIRRSIPSAHEELPAIGLGTWKVFDVAETDAYPRLKSVLKTLYEGGGRLIDSSPMYGRAEEVVGALTADPGMEHDFFYATKVWTEGRAEGIRQMEMSMRKMKRSTIDLMQIHNLVDWQTHLATLRDWKGEGKIRYIGITHYTDDMHGALEQIINKVTAIDFVQFNYAIDNRHAEQTLLPLCADKGLATLINRPLGTGKLMDKTRGKELPAWLADYDITSWGQLFLKFIISHPAVTCVIPGTGSPQHMKDNILAGEGPLPDGPVRQRMAELVADL